MPNKIQGSMHPPSLGYSNSKKHSSKVLSVMVIGYQLLGSRISSTGEQSSSAAVSVGDKTVFTSDDQDNQH